MQTVQKTVLVVDVCPCDQQREVPAVQRLNHPAPGSVHPRSGGHLCCAAENRQNSTGAVLGCLGGC